ncbi:glutamine synthetase [Vibrio cholerae]|nr:glutamine synthetase [Vibrio cholerae]
MFSDDFIDSYIALKTKDVERVNVAVHPLEFELKARLAGGPFAYSVL